MKCCKGGRVIKVSRTWLQKLFYSSIYKCNSCGAVTKLKK